MNKYENGKIYTIRSYLTNKFYIGSTTQPLHKRLHKHRDTLKSFLKGTYHNVSSFEILQYEDNYIELLEYCKCETKQELTKKEGEMIRKYKDMCVNINIAGRTKEEYRIDNKSNIKQMCKDWRDKNIDHCKTKLREWKVDNQEHVKQYDKNYYTNNKLAVCAKRKETYAKNKDKRTEIMLIKRAVTAQCECGVEIKLYDKVRHSKSKTHINNMIKIEEQVLKTA